MASRGIKDRVAIIGMGCTKFGEHWDKGPEDLLVDAAYQAYESAGLQPEDVDAYWLGTMGSGVSGLTLSEPLKIQYKPVTPVENMCATGSEALRQACYAVASGAFDIAMAIGVEKLKDSGYSGLVINNPPNDGTQGSMTAPASFSLLAPAYFKKYGLDPDKGKDVLTRIAWKNHKNGAKNPKAQFQKEVSLETIKNSPKIADPLGIMDCSGVSDGSAAAIVVRAEDAHKYCKNPIYIKALSFIAGPAEGPLTQDYDFTTFREVVATAKDAYAQAGITNPREQISMAEVHDCFTVMGAIGTEVIGKGAQYWVEGKARAEGECGINTSGGLIAKGHPIGATGIAMIGWSSLQLLGKVQVEEPRLAATFNIGGPICASVCTVLRAA